MGICRTLIPIAGLMLGCSAQPGPVARQGAEHRVQPQQTSSAQARLEATHTLAARILAVRGRLTPRFDIPETKGRARCPSGLGDSQADTTVAVRVHDDRYEPRDILPLEFRARLESDELATLGAHYAGGAAALRNLEAAELSGPGSAQAAGRLLDTLARKRYAAVLHVLSYSKPNVFRRKDAIRPEWNPGAIGARFVVYDMDRGTPICEESLAVRGDAKDAPLRRRLRETTRTRLHGELLDRAWLAMRESLSRMSTELMMPPDELRGQASEHW